MLSDIYAQLAAPLATISATVPVVPNGFEGNLPSPPFIRFSVIAPKGRLLTFRGGGRLDGVLNFSILIDKAASGRFVSTVTLLETNLTLRTLGRLQTYVSGYQELGVDEHNKNLSRADWVLPFSYYGDTL